MAAVLNKLSHIGSIMVMETQSKFSLKPIGYMKSIFHFKNGTPRQSSLCQAAKGILTIDKSIFNNPEHSVEGLQEFSHAWVIFLFHKNNNPHSKAKVKPPRLNGRRVGVFSTRSPYRPNNVGLSLAKIDLVVGSSIHLSGIDILDGTPVLDIKPYIPEYDTPMVANDVHQIDTLSNNLEEIDTEMAENNSSVSCQNFAKTPISHFSNSSSLSAENDEKEISESEYHVVEGFYSMSAALDVAGAKISSICSDSISNDMPEKIESVTYICEEPSSQCDFSDLFAASSSNESGSDTFVDFLVSNVLAKAASELDPTNNAVEPATSSANSSDHHKAREKIDIQPPVLSIPKSKSHQPHVGECEHSSSVPHVVQNEMNHRPWASTQGSETVEPWNKINNSTVTAPWLSNPPVRKVKVSFTSDALGQLGSFNKESPDERYRLRMLSDPEEAKGAISNVLHEEPRSVYRRQHCQDSLYFFAIDVLHITCWFEEDSAQVVRIKPVADVPRLKSSTVNSRLKK